MRVGFLFAVSFFLFLKSSYLFVVQIDMVFKLLAILQMYEFSSKSQLRKTTLSVCSSCWRYCKCTSFQANHNSLWSPWLPWSVVGDTANVRVFKQITTRALFKALPLSCWRYCKCTSFQANHNGGAVHSVSLFVVGDTANVRVFKQITTTTRRYKTTNKLLAILQMYEFSSKSQLEKS